MSKKQDSNNPPGNNRLPESALRAINWTATALSIAGVFAGHFMHWFLIPSVSALFFGVTLLLWLFSLAYCNSYSFCKHFRWWGFVLLLLFYGLYEYDNKLCKVDYYNALVSDATEGICEGNYQYGDIAHTWIAEAYKNDELVFILINKDLSPDLWPYVIFNDEGHKEWVISKQNSGFLLPSLALYNNHKNGAIPVTSDYVLVFANARFINTRIDDERIIRLPASSLTVLRGMDLIHGYQTDEYSLPVHEFDRGKDSLEKAASLGNPAASYYLSRLYEYGWGRDVDAKSKELADKYLKQAAKEGSRSARYILGKRILEDSESHLSNVGMAIEYLSSASQLNTVGTDYSLMRSIQAGDFLSKYYLQHGNTWRPYRLTSNFLKSFDYDEYRCSLHLQSCIAREKYEEALEIIRLGEYQMQKPESFCYFIHAEMLMHGLGVEEDLAKAEQLLRYSTDVLGDSDAYSLLADLYRKQGRDGADFLDSLSSIQFNPNVK